jgi:acetyl-CoA C-acetyltransferase
MASHPALILSWARSPVAPVGGAYQALCAHEIAAPVVQALLQRAGVPASAVDALVAGNALGAGGNPARMASLASGLSDACAAYTIDTQCCAGLDAVAMGVGLLASGQAQVVVAGGVEAWSRSPIRQTRPLQAGDQPVAYERPAFAPDPLRDPDLLQSAAQYAVGHGITREQLDAYALLSHARAIGGALVMHDELVEVAGLRKDSYPRVLSKERAVRMPLAYPRPAGESPHFGTSVLAVSTRADGAAFVLLATAEACERFGLTPRAAWVASASFGCAPEWPMLGAQQAARIAMERAGMPSAQSLQVIELHDAFAVQALAFCEALGIETERINHSGGGLARGHPIGASGAVALVRLLAELQHSARPAARGLAAIAGAGGLGAAAIVELIP